MKIPHLARVDNPPEAFATLIAAARAEGLRIGWLDLSLALSLPEPLATAADLGVLRAVAAGGHRTVAVKPLTGAPVLKDLLREHFLGCALVLVRGASESFDSLLSAAPRLLSAPDGFRLESASASATLTAESLAGRLRRAHLLPEA